MGIRVVRLGAHRQETRDLVLTPGRTMGAGALPQLFRTGVDPPAIDGHNGQSRDDRNLWHRLLVLERLDLLIPLVPQLLADFMGDAPDL